MGEHGRMSQEERDRLDSKFRSEEATRETGRQNRDWGRYQAALKTSPSLTFEEWWDSNPTIRETESFPGGRYSGPRSRASMMPLGQR